MVNIGGALIAQVTPIPLRVSGQIPDWLDGVLLKNGPGTFKDKQVSGYGLHFRVSFSFLVAQRRLLTAQQALRTWSLNICEVPLTKNPLHAAFV